MKRIIIPVAAFVAGMAIVPSVFADSYGPTEWTALEACLETDSASVTCTLAGDMDMVATAASNKIEIKKNIVLDLGGKTLQLTNAGHELSVETGGKLTIKNGRIYNGSNTLDGIVYVRGGELVVEDSATIEGVMPVVVSGTNSKATIAGTLLNNVAKSGVSQAALFVHGGANTPEVTLAPTARLESTVGAGLFQSGNATTTVNGATIIGKSGIVIKEGDLTLNDATVKGNGDWDNTAVAQASGQDKMTGAAIQLEGRGTDEIALDINGGTLESVNGSTFFSYGVNTGKVTAMTIDGAYLKAKADTPIWAASETSAITVATWTVDGEENMDLVSLEGSYGTAPAEDAGDNTDDGEEAENPNTADTIATYLTIAAVALLGLGATAFVAKKSNR